MLVIETLENEIFGPVSLTLRAGETLVIEGASGSGKTRFLRALADLDEAQGLVTLDGVNRFAMPATDWRRQLRFLPATSSWWFDDLASHFQNIEKLKTGMRQLALPDKLLTAPVKALSTGERQRFGLLRALEDEPKVLLLDEPTSALDEDAVARVEALIDGEVARGVILMIVSHSAPQRAKYGPLSLHFDEGLARLCQASEG